jgi:very-short-patch-repair endonuclease
VDAFFSVVVLLVFVTLLAGVLLAVLRAKAQGAVTIGDWPFTIRKPLSAPEQILYFRLCSALPDHIVLAQVGLSRFLGVKRGNDFHAWNNRINRMSVDFLVCNKDASVVAAIELDDASHRNPDRVSADAKKDKALDAAGVRLLRWHVNSMPDDSAIRVEVTSAAAAPNRIPPAARQSRRTSYGQA